MLRRWMGTEAACLVFYDNPTLTEEMLDFLVEFYVEVTDRALHDVDPDYFNYFEDGLTELFRASGGNHRIVFCLRGVKSHPGDPHRNLVDFAHVPVVKRLTRLPVCIDPSHSVGSRALAADGLLDIFHTTAQGVVSGANLVLVDFHPKPEEALCDGPQALLMRELDAFLEDVAVAREAYLARLQRVRAKLAQAG